MEGVEEGVAVTILVEVPVGVEVIDAVIIAGVGEIDGMDAVFTSAG